MLAFQKIIPAPALSSAPVIQCLQIIIRAPAGLNRRDFKKGP
jgi:hypothetical protein